MVDNSLTVKVDADTDDAVESIEEVTEAVRELEAALESLQSSDLNIEITGPIPDLNTRDVAKEVIGEETRQTRRRNTR